MKVDETGKYRNRRCWIGKKPAQKTSETETRIVVVEIFLSAETSC